MGDGLGRSFAEALGRKDSAALGRLLQPQIDFRAMTPRQFWEADDSATVIDDILLGKWFEASDEITEVIAIETATVGHRERVGYRFRVLNADGAHIVDQQAYLESDGDRIGWLRVMCAGYLPAGSEDATSNR